MGSIIVYITVNTSFFKELKKQKYIYGIKMGKGEGSGEGWGEGEGQGAGDGMEAWIVWMHGQWRKLSMWVVLWSLSFVSKCKQDGREPSSLLSIELHYPMYTHIFASTEN